MTIQDAIALSDEMRPNQISTEAKVKWLSEIDGRIFNEYISTHEDADVTEYTPYTADKLDNTLLAVEPYTDLYVKFMCAMIDNYQAETGRYNNDMILFNTAWNDYTTYYVRTHLSKRTTIDVR